MLANVGVVVAELAVELGQPGPAAEILGAADALRGGPDPTAVQIIALQARLEAELGGPSYTEAYNRGRALSRTAAVARLDPAGL